MFFQSMQQNEVVVKPQRGREELKVSHESVKAFSLHQRSVLLQLYSSSQDDTEVRIAAYQQLMLCPGPDVFDAVKTTLRSETSSQGQMSVCSVASTYSITSNTAQLEPIILVENVKKVEKLHQYLFRGSLGFRFVVVIVYFLSSHVFLVGSFVWSHLTNLLRSEDPMKQALIHTLPDDIISRDFEGEFLKYSSFSEQTFVSG